MTRQHFFADQTFLGWREIPAVTFYGAAGLRPSRGIGFFCPYCNDLWGKLSVEPSSVAICYTRPCRKHGNGCLAWPLYPSEDLSCLSPNWPPAALARELLCELDLTERIL